MKLSKLLYFTFCMIFFFSIRAYAYLDPAGVTYIIQIVAGFFIAGGLAIGVYWHKLKKFFRSRKHSSK